MVYDLCCTYMQLLLPLSDLPICRELALTDTLHNTDMLSILIHTKHLHDTGWTHLNGVLQDC